MFAMQIRPFPDTVIDNRNKYPNNKFVAAHQFYGIFISNYSSSLSLNHDWQLQIPSHYFNNRN